MYEEMRTLAENFCEKAFDSWRTCGYSNECTAAEFIVKVAEMMLLQAYTWNPEKEEDE